MKKVLIGCGSAIIIFLITFMIIAGIASSQWNEKKPAINLFLDHFYQSYNSKNYSDIYNNLFADETRKTVTIDKLEKSFKLQEKYLGKYVSRNMDIKKMNVRIGSSTEYGKTYTLNFESTYEKGTSTDAFLLKETKDKNFKFLGFQWNTNIK